MTLDEAIRHLTETLTNPAHEWNCPECKAEHEQLAEWLKELKDYREGLRTCENCKYEHKTENEYPCSICRCNHPNKFEWKGGKE